MVEGITKGKVETLLRKARLKFGIIHQSMKKWCTVLLRSKLIDGLTLWLLCKLWMMFLPKHLNPID
ncbi:MAG: hypothetical protein OXC62_07525 [Aestuariivita sp.]|nr:hypothetical protein [Aestuariivita sp.]